MEQLVYSTESHSSDCQFSFFVLPGNSHQYIVVHNSILVCPSGFNCSFRPNLTLLKLVDSMVPHAFLQYNIRR